MEERASGRLLGPLPPQLARLCHTSPIGLIPKPHQLGRWRLIVDLSSPHDGSVDDAISVDHCHMHYASVLHAAAMVRQLGPGTMLAKIDLHHAYRILPVHADDHPLLGINWGGDTLIDTALPFGLRSAPKIFSAFADALAWIMHRRGVRWQLHYLDDFLFLSPPKETTCAVALQEAQATCRDLGVPVVTHKTEGPTTQLTFLGIQMDTEAMQHSLAPEKLSRILALVLSWHSRQSATKQELQSLIGHLSLAATVVLPGRTFLRRMIDLMKVARHPRHHVRLTAEFKSDLHWWASFLLERKIYPSSTGASLFRHSGRLWLVGLWGSKRQGAVVSGRMARFLVHGQYRSQRDGASSYRCSTVGSRLGGEHTPGQVGQHVGSACAGIRSSQRPTTDAPATLSALLQSLSPDWSPVQAYCKGF